jgi:flagellin-like hook-associated protein FlgL
MANYINSNAAAVSARRFLDRNSVELTRAQNQLSSGLLTYDPAELPAASAIGIQFSSDIQILAQATSNATQASALVQLAAGTLQGSNEILSRMNILAAQSNSASVGANERKMFDLEYQALMQQLDSNAGTSWRGTALFQTGDGSVIKNAANGAYNTSFANNASYNDTTLVGALSLPAVNGVNSYLELAGDISGTVSAVSVGAGSGNSYVTVAGVNFTSIADLSAEISGPVTFSHTDANGVLREITVSMNYAVSSEANIQNDLVSFFDNLSLAQNTNGLINVPGWFAGGIDLANTTGLYDGTATFASVKITPDQNYYVEVTIGDQVFTSDENVLNEPEAGGALVLTSKTNTSNKISLAFDHSNNVNFSSPVTDLQGRAEEYQIALRTMLGINSTLTAPASFTSRSAEPMPGISPIAGNGLKTGTYGLSFDAVAGTFTLTQPSGVDIIKEVGNTLVNDSVVDFGNGLSVQISDKTAFDATKSKDFTTILYDGLSMTFQTGINSSETIEISFTAATSQALDLKSTNVLQQTSASKAAEAIAIAMQTVNLKIANFGSIKSKLDYVVKNLSIYSQNLSAAKSTFTDTDIPESLATAQRYQALVDVSSSVFQQTIQKESKLAQMIQSTFR